MSIKSISRHRQRRRKNRTTESVARPAARASRSARQRAVACHRKASLHPWVAKGISRLQCHRAKSGASVTA